MEDQIVLRVISRFIIPFVLMYALYVQFHGEYSPGGGFQAGVIFAAAFILHGLVFGLEQTQRVISIYAVRFMAGLGALIYSGTGVLSMIKGGAFLDYSVLSSDPVSGQKIGILVIELGVGLTVFAVMLLVYYVFAGREAQKEQD